MVVRGRPRRWIRAKWGQFLEEKTTFQRAIRAISAVVVAVGTITGAIVAVLALVDSNEPAVSVAIDSPAEEATVPRDMFVAGTATLAPDLQLWVLLFESEAGVYYTTSPVPLVTARDGRWGVDVKVGHAAGDDGKPYEVVALVLTDRGSGAIRRAMGDAKVGDKPSLAGLPADRDIKARDRVRIRKAPSVPTVSSTPTLTPSRIPAPPGSPGPRLVPDRSWGSFSDLDGLTWANGSVWVLSGSRMFRYTPQGDQQSSHTVSLEGPFPESRAFVTSVAGLTWDGGAFWTIATMSATTPEPRHRLYRFTLDGERSRTDKWVGAPPPPGVTSFQADLDWDGTALWYVGDYNIYRVDPTGNIASQFPVDAEVTGTAWDGSRLFVATNGACSGTVARVEPRQRMAPKPAPTAVFEQADGLQCLESISWDDGHLWGVAIEKDDPQRRRIVVRLRVP